MRALFVDHTYPGNLGTYAECLAATSGWDVRFFANEAGPAQGKVKVQTVKGQASSGPDTHATTRDFEVQVKGARQMLHAALKEYPKPPDVVVTGCGRSSALLFGAHWTVPIVPYVHAFQNAKPRLAKVGGRAELAALAGIFSNAARLLHLLNGERAFTSSRYQLQMVPAEFQHKLRLIPRPVNTDFFAPEAAWPSNWVKIPRDAPLVTFVSENPWENGSGLDCFVRACRATAKAVPEVYFAILGGGSPPAFKAKLREALAAAALDPKRFLLMPPPDEKAAAGIMARSAVCVYGSDTNAVGPHFFGAMAAGGGVLIGSDTAPVREFLRHGQNGLLYGSGKVRELAAGIRAVLADREGHARLATASRQFAVAHLSFAALGPQFSEFLSQPQNLLPDDFCHGQSLLEEE